MGSQENGIVAAKAEETVQKTIGHSRFMPTYGFTRAPRPGRARSGIRRWFDHASAVAAQGFTLFGHGCFFAFERLARLLVASAFRLQARAARSGSRSWSANGSRLFNTGLLIATFSCAAPARCRAFADERRVVACDGGGAHRSERHYQARLGI